MLKLPRLTLFEFCDQSWLKGIWREAYIDCLDNIHLLFAPHKNLPKLMGRWSEELAITNILDIGSGGGEQINTLNKFSDRDKIKIPCFTLSDLYPNLENYQKLSVQLGRDRLHYLIQPVPISNIPREYKIISMFSVFHHLSNSDAKVFILEFVKNRDGLCIFEFTNRRFIDLTFMIPSILISMIAPLFAKRFHWLKFLFCTIIPIIPIIVCFDGIVSVFRSYHSKEIIAMIPESVRSEFIIESGMLKWGRLPLARTNYVLFSRRSKVKNARGPQ